MPARQSPFFSVPLFSLPPQPSPDLKFGHPIAGVRGQASMLRDSFPGYWVRGSGCGVPGSRFRVPGSGSRVPGARCQVWGLGFGVQTRTAFFLRLAPPSLILSLFLEGFEIAMGAATRLYLGMKPTPELAKSGSYQMIFYVRVKWTDRILSTLFILLSLPLPLPRLLRQ